MSVPSQLVAYTGCRRAEEYVAVVDHGRLARRRDSYQPVIAATS
jgi:hypothetical protein